MRPAKLLVVCGPSGVGKSTVVRELAARRQIHFSVSVTTRAPRSGEADGVDYTFVSVDDFEAMRDAGELLEWASYSGHLYGTPSAPVFEQLEKGVDVMLNIEVQGAMQVKAAVPEAVTVFLLPPSTNELEQRLRSRADTTPEQTRQRLEIARWEIEIAPKEFDHLIVNDDLGRVVTEIERILDLDLT